MLLKNREKIRVVVIGAGPAGLTAAYELAKRNVKSIVFEKDPKYVGGLAKTINFKGFRFDIGGHRFFSKNKEVEDLWKRILGKDLFVKKRFSRIYYRGKFYDYPLKLFNVLTNLGLGTIALVALSYFLIKAFPIRKEVTFEQWVSNRFGRKLYEIFFKTYTQKVWGIDPAKISAEWAEARIQNFNFGEIIANLLFRRKNSMIKTLVDRFKYPKYGPGMLWERVRKITEKKGSRVVLGAEVVALECAGKVVKNLVVNRGGQKEKVFGTHFLSSMPLSELIHSIKPAPSAPVLAAAKNLKFRDFLVVMLVVNKSRLFDDQWIYIHEPDVQVARIQNFKNWSKFMVPNKTTTCLGLEYFCLRKDELWNLDDNELFKLASEELEQLGLADKKDILSGKVVRVENAYPVYDKGYRRSLNIVRNYLARFRNLQVIGRGGMHKYNNQDHAMMTGMLAARNITGEKFDLWRVDADAMCSDVGVEGVAGRVTPNKL